MRGGQNAEVMASKAEAQAEETEPQGCAVEKQKQAGEIVRRHIR
jgi:hypothetical protein